MEAADASPLEVSPRAGSWRRSKTWSRSSSLARSGSSSCGSGSIEYTSIRDVLEEEQSSAAATATGWGGGGSGGWGEYSSHDIHDFDANNIGIRNQLLKHAASAYLQSAVVVAPGGGGREDDYWCCLVRLWRRAVAGGGRRGTRGGRGRLLVRACASCWQGCVDDPAAFVARSARRIAAFVAARVGAACQWNWNSSPRAVSVAYDDYRHADLAAGCDDRCIE